MDRRFFRIGFLAVFWLTLPASCHFRDRSGRPDVSDSLPTGDLIVFHAGSVTLPVRAIADSFQKRYPDVRILHEAAGSRECARKISDLKKPCDIFVSADVDVIESLLYPDYVSGWAGFATNEMVIAYTPASRYAAEIDSSNWMDILLRKDVVYGRSDPNADPCGYRTLMTLELAEQYYRKPGLEKAITTKDRQAIRPKETDLLALIETRNIDYLFIYRSVATQHHLKYIELPPGINLSKPELNDLYAGVRIKLSGKTPKESIIQQGAAMVYGVTIVNQAPNRIAAEAYLAYFLSRKGGLAVFDQMGQPVLYPVICVSPDGKNLWRPCAKVGATE